MARFYWTRQYSRSGFIHAVATRIHIKGLTLEKAMDLTFSKEVYARNVHLISKREINRLEKEINGVLVEIKQSRQAATSAAGGQ
ncbi:hypothetical protein [Paenibacillus massiliensis]|uniref:hypothetical protein n=1 Tax=Paenibacillus massiliensis TaxID=225917 RepID=UPI0004247196|nr:hypothetical protein [Paenibacillus massiliensis]